MQRISQDGTLEDVEVVEVFTIKPNGQKIAVDPSSILSQQATQHNTRCHRQDAGPWVISPRDS